MTKPAFPLTSITPIACAAALLAAGAVHGQESDSPAPQTLQTVVISASADASAEGLTKAYSGGQVARGGRVGLLGNVDMMDTPFNATSYTQQLLQDQQTHSVADVLQNDPGVRVTRGFGNYQEMYVIRGFAANSDDLAYNGLYGILPRQYVATELLERVEVFRGASAFLNGAAPGGGGIGGSINLLPKRAGNAALTSVTAGVESGGQGYAAADIGRRFGPGDRAGIRINVVRRDGDTAVDREQRELSLASVGLDWNGGNYRLSADVGYQDHRLTAARPSVNVNAGVPVPAVPDGGSNYAQPWTHSNERDTFGTLRGELDLAKDTVAWAAFGARSGQESNILAAPRVAAADGTAAMYRFDNERKDTVRTGEVGARTRLRIGTVGHAISATATGFWNDSRNAYAMSNSTAAGMFRTNLYAPVDAVAPAATYIVGGRLDAPGTTGKTILSSYAIADTLSLLDERLLVTVGLRHQRIRDYSYNYNTGAETSAYDESRNTPVAAVVFKPSKQVSVYANYIEGLQKGMTASGTGVINLGETFAPTVSRQKEIGAKYDAGTIGFSAAAFVTAQPQAYVVDNVYGLNGEQRNRGVEMTVFGQPVRGLRLLGGVTFIDAEQRRTNGGLRDGHDAVGVPDRQLNLNADWDVPGMRGLALNGRVAYTSKQYLDGANLQQVPSWARTDVGIRYLASLGERTLTLRARIDNLFDRDYWASAGGASGAGYLVQGTPRTVAVSATLEF
ncbi:TonB-dependent receptor [Pseudoduganella umbonata]|uniref:Iron complex outermembrane receptor protein n=1 Tax=Pseudoduganella umbonata TaxID=864828 RepID=A0A4V1ECY4_9BURK|nr:TonB-dependent siderophore receptor [Pseudoduganella umbonata]MBB3224908.1 iron complex outermembrane receptor protein [Pseudoduganella umbonata]QCP09191.1 TonB-dependent siderophore receptor [Pseudoduganella umbonata]